MKLADANLLKLLPAHLAEDPQLAAAGQAANPVIASISRAIPNLLIWARLGNADPARFLPPLARLTETRGGLAPLDLETLESLAWQFHVDFREAARTNAELAGMVRNSISWHRIKGTPASIRAALELCGFGVAQTQDASGRAAGARQTPRSLQATARSGAGTRRAGGITIEERDPSMHWATYQLGFSELASLDDLARIVAICREMQPARCRLWRVYVDDFDMRPGAWSGPLPRNSWSNAWWSYYSGEYIPDIPGLDDRGLMVSFGLKRRFQSEPFIAGQYLAHICHELARAWLVRNISHHIWSYSRWGDLYPRRHGFSCVQTLVTHAADMICAESGTWQQPDFWPEGWIDNPWASKIWLDRRLPEWAMLARGICKSQGVYSDASDKQGSVWSGLNCNWSVPYFDILPKPPRWSGKKWSAAQETARRVIITEQFRETRQLGANALAPAFHATAAAFGSQIFSRQIRHMRGAVWGSCHYGDSFPQNHGMCGHAVLAAIAGEPLESDATWNDTAWPDLPWRTIIGYGRVQQPFSIIPAAQTRCAPVAPRTREPFAFAAASNFASQTDEISTFWTSEPWPDFPWDGPPAHADISHASSQTLGAVISNIIPMRAGWDDSHWSDLAWNEGIGAGLDEKYFGANISLELKEYF